MFLNLRILPKLLPILKRFWAHKRIKQLNKNFNFKIIKKDFDLFELNDDKNKWNRLSDSTNNKNKKNYLKYKKGIDQKSLNKKQRFLINAPSFVLRSLVSVKGGLEKVGLQLSTYK